jgi:hypothetical protein
MNINDITYIFASSLQWQYAEGRFLQKIHKSQCYQIQYVYCKMSQGGFTLLIIYIIYDSWNGLWETMGIGCYISP